eukprot:sb/3470674/
MKNASDGQEIAHQPETTLSSIAVPTEPATETEVPRETVPATEVPTSEPLVSDSVTDQSQPIGDASNGESSVEKATTTRQNNKPSDIPATEPVTTTTDTQQQHPSSAPADFSDAFNSTAAAPSPSSNLPQTVFHVKWYDSLLRKQPIIMQSVNGPCPLLAIVNCLLLQQKIDLPAETEHVSAETLCSVLGELFRARTELVL